EFVARHDSALAITRRIEDINRESFDRRRKSLAESQDQFIHYIWATVAVTLGLGFVIAGASGYGMYRLQLRADRQRQRREKAESELRRLSSQLLHTQEEERRHLSRELHDEVGQTLTALGMELGNVEQLRAGPPHEFTAHLRLRRTSEQVRLELADDGIGFGADASYRGMGLIGIEERVRELGGTVEIASGPGEGARLSVEIPLNGNG